MSAPEPRHLPVLGQPPRWLGLQPLQRLGWGCRHGLAHWWDSDPKRGVMLRFFHFSLTVQYNVTLTRHPEGLACTVWTGVSLGTGHDIILLHYDPCAPL